MSVWIDDAVVYHIFPLGLCGAPRINDPEAEPVDRLKKIYPWIEHISGCGFNTLMMGPVFESSTHGYDITDYFSVDKRLGRNDTLKKLVDSLHCSGIRVVLDAVFNHTGRGFHCFRDILSAGENSDYVDWYCEVNFSKRSPCGDPFDYETWNGHYRFAKLNLKNPHVRNYLFEAVRFWIAEFDIDGLRLDCADSLDFSFMKELSSICVAMKPGFWLLGEVIHGDYGKWISDARLHSVTNYNCYKALYSAHNDKNYYEIAHTLRRQFNSKNGIYKETMLYNFTDNHDVNRIASVLKTRVHIYPLHIMLFTIPGIPSVYYGSEWGIEGIKSENDDPLRPELDIGNVSYTAPERDLVAAIKRLIKIRSESDALKSGEYIELKVMHEQFAYARISPAECMIVIVNSSNEIRIIRIELPVKGSEAIDMLNEGESFRPDSGMNLEMQLYPNWGRILRIIP